MLPPLSTMGAAPSLPRCLAADARMPCMQCTLPCSMPAARRHYRKHLLAKMPQLNYLDESPCFPKDRRLAEAFLEGGVEAERAMRETIR